MAIFKIVGNPCNTDEALHNLCNYIVRPDRTNGLVAGRGLRPECAYEDICAAQELYGKCSGRRAYHLLLAFDDLECIVPTEAEQIAFQVSSLFFPEFQVLYSVHTEQAHLHIHFAINTVSLFNGPKLHLTFKMLARLNEDISSILQKYQIES